MEINARIFDRFNPKSTFKLVLLAFVGALLGTVLQDRFTNPTEFLKWCFVIVAIPGFILSIIGWFADNPKRDWKTSQVGRWVYRLSGILIFLAAIQIVRGADLAGWIIG